MPPEKLKILMLEDSETDAEIIHRVLKKELQAFEFKLVTNKEAYLIALDEYHPDLILSDNSLPQFSAIEALIILQQRLLFIPFIIVSGAISEEFAVDIIKHGADDYILKDRLTRLPVAIKEVMAKRETNHRLYETLETLQKANKELEQFSFISSHDLQEPLRTISSFSELLLKEYKQKLDGNGEMYLNFIQKSVERMQILVKGLLDYSRIGKEIKISEADCNQIANDVIVDLGAAIAECNAHIQIQQLPVLHGNPTELRQLFQNLLSNAIKYRAKDTIPEIIITAEEQTKHWLFGVHDNGIGIEDKNQEKIFIIFKRLNNRNEYEGTGIGLSHCKKIVEFHGGKIWVESKLKEGSIFYFTILKQ